MDQKKIGGFLAALRKNRGITQQELGEHLGVTNKTVSRWETGKYMPDISLIPDLCRYFDISVNEFVCGERFETENFCIRADVNILELLKQDKKLRILKQLSEMLGGAGTGLILSVLYNPDRLEKTVVAAVGFFMICLGWYFRQRIEKSRISL